MQTLVIILCGFGTYGLVHFVHDTIKFIVEMRYEAKKFKQVEGALDAITRDYHNECERIVREREGKSES